VANTISNVYVSTFENFVRHQAQQEISRLLPYVQVRGEESLDHNWEKLGVSEMSLKTTRKQATPTADTPWARRVAISQTWDNGDSTELEDPAQMIVDPNSNLIESLGYSARRKQDDVILTACSADALEGDGSTTSFPVGQIVGDYTTPISFDFITAIQEKFMANDIDMSIPKVAVVGPTQVRKLMQLTEQTSADYVHREALQQLTSVGVVPMWMGFTWVCSTRLNYPTAPGTDVDCFFMTRRAIGMNIPKNITARIAEDPSISFAWQIYIMTVMGAVRVEDLQIVWGQLADTL
jgi:hypothetical protein